MAAATRAAPGARLRLGVAPDLDVGWIELVTQQHRAGMSPVIVAVVDRLEEDEPGR